MSKRTTKQDARTLTMKLGELTGIPHATIHDLETGRYRLVRLTSEARWNSDLWDTVVTEARTLGEYCRQLQAAVTILEATR